MCYLFSSGRGAVSLSTVGISLTATVGWIPKVLMASLDDVGCIVWMDSRDIRYKECVNMFFEWFGY